MLLNQSNAIGLAKVSCSLCHGIGVRTIRTDTEVPCNCIFRAIFRACLNRFRQSSVSAEHIGSVSLEFCRGSRGRRIYSRKQQEFAADFCLVSRRALDDVEYTVFKYHFLLGAGWTLCCSQLKLDRGSFFHMVYRIEQKLGRIFCELKPYGLYPLNEYFGGLVRRKPMSKASVPPIAA